MKNSISIQKLELTDQNIEIVSKLIEKDKEGKCFCNKDLEGNIIPLNQMASIYLKYADCYCICYDNQQIGLLCLENGNEVAIFIDPSYQGKGIGTKALKQFLNMIISENIEMDLIIAEITLDNEKSIHLFNKLGFSDTKEIRKVPLGGENVKVKKYVLNVNHNVNKK